MVLTVTSLLEVDGCPPIKLREERDNEDVPLRTGCRVWSCARLLAEWLANRSGGGEDDGAGPIVVGRDVLELGAGTGAVGLTCAALGASSVTMTDRDEATLALMHTNARINGHYDASSTCEVCIQVLDWGDPATFIQGASYDLIVAADVLYLPEHCAALPDAVAAHLAPGGKVAVACGLRRRGLLDALVDSLRSVGLDPSVERETLGLDPSGGDARNRRAAAVTASEHAHDGAQISAAGGYALVTASVKADWKPPERLSARAVADAKRGREEEERNEASRREEEERNEASRPRIRGKGNRIVGARRSEERKGGDGAVASETAATREEDRDGDPGEIDSDANSAMGDFLDDFEDLGVDAGAPVTRAVPAADDDDNEEEADLPPYRVHPSPAEVASGAPSASTIVAAADSLARNGFVVLEAQDGAGLVASDVLDSALTASDGYLDRLLAAAKAKGLRVDSDIFRFAELCSRARGGRRFDVTAERRRCGNDGSITLPPRPYPTSDDESAAAAATDAWDGLRRAADPWVSSALLRSGLMVENDGTGVTFGVIAVGCVTSLPSAPEQHFHADGRERGIVNVFVPLVDVPASMGPTHFRRGSHVWDHDSPYLTREQRRAREGAEDVVPELRRGSVLMYDYRVFHRGGANLTGKRRPVAYVMYARDGTEDTWNFPDESVWDPDSTGAG